VVQVAVPRALSKRAKKLLKELDSELAAAAGAEQSRAAQS
jgi:hypothetical protein